MYKYQVGNRGDNYAATARLDALVKIIDVPPSSLNGAGLFIKKIEPCR
jgi:hypothetical protein